MAMTSGTAKQKNRHLYQGYVMAFQIHPFWDVRDLDRRDNPVKVYLASDIIVTAIRFGEETDGTNNFDTILILLLALNRDRY